MTDVASRTPGHDELWELVRQRLVEDGLSQQRAEVLATALVDPESRLDALVQLEDRLHRLTDVVERLTTRVEDASGPIEPAAAGVAPAKPSATEPAPGNGRASGARHPIRAVEREAEHLRDVASKGESARTPAIVAGGMMMVLVPLFALVLVLVLGTAYLVTRGGGGMPSFKGTLKQQQQIDDVAAYVTARSRNSHRSEPGL